MPEDGGFWLGALQMATMNLPLNNSPAQIEPDTHSEVFAADERAGHSQENEVSSPPHSFLPVESGQPYFHAGLNE